MRWLVAIGVIACTTPRAPELAPPAPDIAFGPLRLAVVVSADASRFHAVDQLSAWYPYHHAAFGVLAVDLTDAERVALADHRAIRATHPWGRGLEATYYLGAAGAIDADTRAREAAILGALEPIVAPLVARTQPHVVHFAQTIAAPISRAAAILEAAGRLFGTPPRSLPIVLVARPGGGVGGGGANGGVLVVEVTDDEQSLTPVVHESVHALIEPRRAELRAAAARCGTQGVDATAFEEGLVHAIAPGLIHDGDGDPLAASSNRFYRLGAAVRPAIQRALAGGSFATLLDDACTAYRTVPPS